jgi:CheY-like chemotaxis protein
LHADLAQEQIMPVPTKILIVDDQREGADALADILRIEGFDAATAYRGKQALNRLPEKFDLIILDYMMPEMNGDEFLEHMKRTPYRDVPVFFLSCADTSEFDADGHFTKPADLVKLISAIRNL